MAIASTVSFQQEAQSQQRQQKLSGGPQDSYQLWKAAPLRVVKMDPAAKARGIQKDFSSEAFSELRKSAQAAVDLPGTTALALVDKGVLVFEGYGLSKGATPEGRFVSMSVAKSVTALAVGEAFCAGKINDLADKAEGYAPSLKGTSYGESSVRDLLMMASGAKSGTIESHGQPHPTATRENLLGSRTIAEHIEQFKDRNRTAGDAVLAGTRFAYNNLDTAALAFVVQGATGMPFHQWTQQTIVEKSGFADSSFWHVDRAGQPINYAYFNASLEDWIRLTLRFREIIKGETDEPCLTAFMESGTKTLLPTFRASWSGYGYQIWTDHPRFRSTFGMLGFGGQRIAIDPVTDRILITFAWSPEDQVLTLFNNWNRPR
jgi:CubicO group peptidase (beta-lactamase class C family)